MNILIDTHIALWALYDPDPLWEMSKNYLTDPGNSIWYSLVSAWEIDIKHNLGKLDVVSDAFIQDCEAIGFQTLPIRKNHITGMKNIPYFADGFEDPFDRLLLAQAAEENLFFLTQDHKILKYDQKSILRK